MYRYGSLIAISLLLLTNPAFAATLTVTNLDDSGPGSLRQALLDGQTGDEVRFDASLNGSTITVTTPLSMTSSMTVSALDLPDGITLSGGGSTQILLMDIQDIDNITTIEGLNFTDGFSELGGAVFAFSASLVFKECSFSNNQALDNGGALLTSTATTVIINSTFFNNSAPRGSAISTGGSPIYMANTTLVGNLGGNEAAALEDVSGGAEFLIRNSTIVGNNRGIASISVPPFSSPTFENSIIAGNINDDIFSGFFSLFGFGSSGYNLFGTIDSSTTFFSHGTDQLGVNALDLFVDVDGNNVIDSGDLQNLGGRTLVLEPQPDSPLIDAGNPDFEPSSILDQVLFPPPAPGILQSFIQSLTQGDQRGSGFPRLNNNRLDIGAVEFGGTIPVQSIPVLNRFGLFIFILTIVGATAFWFQQRSQKRFIS